MIEVLTSAFDALMSASELPAVLDEGTDGVYFWLGSAVQDVAAAGIPAYGAAIATCNTAIASTGVGSESECSDKAADLLASVIRDICEATGLNYVIDGIVWAWQQIPDVVKDGLGYAVDAIGYLADAGDIAADFVSRVGQALVNTEWLRDAADYLVDEVLAAVGSRLGSLVRGAASAVSDYAGDLADRVITWVETGTGFVKDVTRYIYAGAAAVWYATGDVGKAIAESVVWLAQAAEAGVDVVVDVVSDVVTAGAEAIADGAEAVADAAVDVVDAGIDAVGDVVDGAGDFLSDLF